MVLSVRLRPLGRKIRLLTVTPTRAPAGRVMTTGTPRGMAVGLSIGGSAALIVLTGEMPKLLLGQQAR